VLDLAYNNLVDLPASFSGLVSLRHLDLTYNHISEVSPRSFLLFVSIPFSVFFAYLFFASIFIHLFFFLLFFFKHPFSLRMPCIATPAPYLTKVDDHALVGMSKLQFFEMHHNSLVGRAPRSIGDMSSMNRLDLRSVIKLQVI